MATGDYSEAAGRRLMMHLCSLPSLGNVTENYFGENASDQRESGPKETILAVKKQVNDLKIQLKGNAHITKLPISSVRTWGKLLEHLSKLCPPGETSTSAQITTYDGDLITSAADYTKQLKPGLHLILSFPAPVYDEDQLSSAFDNLWIAYGETEPNPSLYTDFLRFIDSPGDNYRASPNDFEEYVSCSSRESSSGPKTPLPLYTGGVSEQAKKKRFHLQTPTITIYPSKERKLSVELLSNANFPNVWFYSPAAAEFDLSASSSSSLPLFGDPSRTGLYGHDVYHNNRRRIALRSMGWEIFARPPKEEPLKIIVAPGGSEYTHVLKTPESGGGRGFLKDAVSSQIRTSLSWGILLPPPPAKGSEKRIYAFHEPRRPPVVIDDNNNENEDEGDEEENSTAVESGWWMVPPSYLPTRFSGAEEASRVFMFRGLNDCTKFLSRFMIRCGLGTEEIQEFVAYWSLRLSPAFDKYLKSPCITASAERDITLVKFLYPHEIACFLPVRLTPEPERLTRVFAVFRVLTEKEMMDEECFAEAVFEEEVERVAGTEGACGGGLDCGHGGYLRVFEVGGVRVFGGDV